MFLKPYKQKSNVALKGSEAKRLRQRLERAFPDVSTEQLLQLLPSAKTLTQLKLVTHNGFQTNVFCVDKLPMFFEFEKDILVPTLYAMWQVPYLLPHFTTYANVLPHLINGADLMLPGLLPLGTGMNKYGRYKKNQVVAVNLITNKSTVGIGLLTRSSDDLYMCGGQGSAVKMLHLFGDKLWGHEPLLTQQMPQDLPTKLTNDDFPALGANKNKSTIILKDPIDTIPESLRIVEVSEVIESSIEVVPASVEDAESGQVSIEKKLRNAFLSALKNNGKLLQLPLLTSTFYRQYMLPELSENLDIKKTKFKKLSNFLHEMVDENFIVVREETKGVDKIISIDFEHPELVNFITDVKQPSSTSDAHDGQEQTLFHSELTEMYIVTDETAPFFTKMNYKRGEGIPLLQIKKIIREYISKNNLPMANQVTKTILLDETLKQICECTEAAIPKVLNTIISKMNHSFKMCTLKNAPTNKPLIQMSLATRSGNKKVTLVSNVECYGIILPEFIKLCKQGAAASTTIIKLPNQKKDLLQIQGNQVRFIYNLLTETYKVPAKYILGLELAKDGKKHKKK